MRFAAVKSDQCNIKVFVRLTFSFYLFPNFKINAMQMSMSGFELRTFISWHCWKVIALTTVPAQGYLSFTSEFIEKCTLISSQLLHHLGTTLAEEFSCKINIKRAVAVVVK